VQFSLAPPLSLGDRQHAAPSSHTALTAPMPGTVNKHFVEEGMAVAANQPLLAIEAMKMEHIVVAPYAGLVKRLPFAVGTLASAGAILVVLEPREGEREPE
jgi:3-methylcrotonyl-CoA carboxylase alpha subunit